MLDFSQIGKTQWWERADVRVAYEELAANILQQGGAFNDDIVSIGQSPAWVCYYIEQNKNRPGKNVAYVPFSTHKSYGEQNSLSSIDAAGVAEYTEEYKIPNIAQYRDFLASRGMDPESIIKRHNVDKTKTSFIDVIESGQGLAEFVYILASWAKDIGKLDELKSSVNIIALKAEDQKLIEIKYPDLDTSFAINGLSTRMCRFLIYSDQKTARLVPAYDSKSWLKPPARLRMPFVIEAIKSAFRDQSFVTRHPLRVMACRAATGMRFGL